MLSPTPCPTPPSPAPASPASPAPSRRRWGARPARRVPLTTTARPHLRGGPGMSAALRRMRAPLSRHVCAQTDWCCFRGKMRICVRSVMLTLFTQEILRRLSASVFPCPADTASPARSRSERDCVCKPGLAAEPRGPTAYACAACTAGTFSTAANSSACEACAPKQVLFKCAGCSLSDAG